MSESRAAAARALRVLFGLAVAAVSLWLAFRRVEWGRALEGFRAVSLGASLGLLALIFGSVFVRALLWRRFARRLGDAPLGLAVRSLFVGMLANNVLPARLGELARSGLWAARTGVGAGPALGVLAAERSLDLVALGTIAAIVLPRAPVSASVRSALTVGAVAGVAVAVVFVVLARMRFSGLGRISRTLGRLAEGFQTLGRPREMVVPLLLSASIWVLTFAYHAASLRAFGIDAPPGTASLLLVSTQLAVVLPSAPSFAGPYHLAVTVALTAYGIDRDRAAGFAIFNHLAWVLPTSLAGVVALLREGWGFDRMISGARGSP